MTFGRGALIAGALGAAALAVELRLSRSTRPISDAWQHVPVAPRGSTKLGISFRPRQAEAFDLQPAVVLDDLLTRPFHVIRLGVYWDRVEPRPGVWDFGEVDRQLDAAERAGKEILLGVGALKTFGYPEYFVPAHRLSRPLPEGRLVTPNEHRDLLAAACEQVERVVERYRGRPAVTAWQVEHEAVDPLGFEHSWRLDAAFVEAEVVAVKRADSTRPVLLNGYLAGGWLEGVAQRWRTRDQGDSLDLARGLADWMGVDSYPRHALAGLGPWTLYADGGSWERWRRGRLLRPGQRLVVTEGQAEPWEALTVPPNAAGRVPASCPPERLIGNYNRWVGWAQRSGAPLEAYLFWGAEYWLLRARSGDPGYLAAFERVLAES